MNYHLCCDIWGLGIGDWGLGIGPNPQSPIPNPQSPLPFFSIANIKLIFNMENKNDKIKSILTDFSTKQTLDAPSTEIPQVLSQMPKAKIFDHTQKQNSTTKTESKSARNNIKNTLHLKIGEITSLSYFINNYCEDSIQIVTTIIQDLTKTVNLAIDKGKYFTRFYKDVMTLYESFSHNLFNANHILNFHIKTNERATSILKIGDLANQTQSSISESISLLAKQIQSKLISNGPLLQIKSFYDRINVVNKEINLSITVILEKKEKMVKKHKRYEKFFEIFKQMYNDNDKLFGILEKNDFVFVEYDYYTTTHRILTLVKDLFTQAESKISELKGLYTNLMDLIRESIHLYIEESQKYITYQNMDNLMQSYEECLNKEDIEMFFEHPSNKVLDEKLKAFQTNLLKFYFIKNEKIAKDEFFVLSGHKNYTSVVEFISSLTVPVYEPLRSNLILFSCFVKKIVGIFGSKRDCLMIFTAQQTLIVFEGTEINQDSYEEFNCNLAVYKKIDDTRNPFRFELSEVKVGIIYNSTYKLIFEAQDENTLNEIKNRLVIDIK